MSTVTLNWLRRSVRPQVLRRTTRQSDGQRRFAGDTPTPNSMKARLWEGHPTHKEAWENDLYATYGISVILLIMVYMRPDTNIQTWANEEAQARLDLKARGFDNFEFGKHYKTQIEGNQEEEWEKFNNKAIKPGEDDDDDDEEEDDDDDDDDDE
mmetsp:Transcript_14537/g.21441  ORF Transcript_14537/g.21441 Transcript_14537/m.21441 type:complete len:154 (-) Transcript_14537:278-739(-)